MYQIDENALNRLDNTKPVDNRDPFFAEGQTRAVLVSLIPFMHKTYGPSARARFKVLASQAHPVGSFVVKLWFLTKPSKFESQPNDGDRFADFVRKLRGAPDGTPVGPQIRALIATRVQEQLARGSVIEGFGVNTSKKVDKPFVDVRWASVPQTPEQIAQMRAQLDADPVCAVQNEAPGAAPVQYQQPQYAQPPMGPPPGVPMQYQQPMGPPPGVPMQPPMGAAPMQGFAPAPQQAPVAAPQGGFLAQLPPAPGSTGGNTGGGW